MSSTEDIANNAFIADVRDDALVLQALGEWTYHQVAAIDKRLGQEVLTRDYEHVTFDFTHIETLDTAGAYILARTLKCEDGTCSLFDTIEATEGQKKMLRAAADAQAGTPPKEQRHWYDMFTRVGKATFKGVNETYDTIAFVGKTVTEIVRSFFMPGKVRWKSVVALTERVGIDALPIVIILSFFIGCVIAFMGAQLLRAFGVQIFMVDLVGLSVLREFAVLIMAIMMAARSNSAFTAQIGSMKMRQEIDAMTVIGMDTANSLVAPRVLACLISAPILTFAGMMSGLIGGATVARFTEGISFSAFFVRILNEIPIDHFWVGMIKAPVFALVIAVIGCRQGLAVQGSVESLGQRTTSSVVQAIFAVIVLDAIFAMFFLEIGY